MRERLNLEVLYRYQIQGPYNAGENEITQVLDNPPAELNSISRRDYDGRDFIQLRQSDQRAVCRKWLQQGRRYIPPPRAVQPVLLTQLGQAPQYLGHADFVSQQPFDVPHVTWDGDEQLAVEEVFRFDFTHDIPPQHSGDGGFEY